MAQSSETKLNKRFDQNIEITGTLTVGGSEIDFSSFLTSYTETDPTVPSYIKSITTTNISNWDTAYGWGNHADANYLTSYTETDTLQSVTNRAATTTNNITLNGSALQFDTNSASVTTIAKMFFGTFPSPDGSLAASSSVDDYGVDTYGIILQSGYEADMGGIKIADDGVVVWGAGDSDLFKVVDEDSNVDRFKIDNNGKGTFNYGLDVNGSITVSAPDAFILTNNGTGTYNKAVIYSDAGGFLLEGAKATDSNGAAKLPVTLTWRGNYNGNGGLKLTGDIKLYTDNTGLAINHTSPSYTLDVNGSFRSAGIWSTASAVTHWGGGASATAYGTLTWDTGYASIYANSGNVLKLGAGGTQGYIIIDTSGNTTFSGQITNSSVIRQQYNTQNWINYVGSNGDWVFRDETNSRTHLVFQNDGDSYFENKVGISTSSPIAKLTLPLEEESNYKIAFKSAGTTHAGISTVDQSGAGLYVGANSYVNASGAVVTNDSDYPSFGMYLDGWSSDEIKFYTAASGTPTNKMSLTSNGVLVVGNGVRIGTITNYTSQTLQVNGFIDQTDTSAAFRLYNGSTFVGGIGNGNWAYGASWNGYYSIYANSSLLLFNAGGGNSPTMALDNNGNLGLANTSPQYYSGYKTLHIGNASTGGQGLIKLGTGATMNGPEIYVASDGKLRLNTDGSTNVAVLSGSNFGIGTASPEQRLHVEGTIQLGNTEDLAWAYDNGSYYNYITNFYNTTDGMVFRSGGWTSGNNIDFSFETWYNSGWNKRLVIQADGVVGISTNPSSAGGVYHYLQLGTYSNGQGVWLQNSSNDTGLEINNDGSRPYIGVSYRSTAGYKPLALRTSGTERISILANGYVGINNTNPASTLDVNGTQRIVCPSNAEAIRINGRSSDNIGEINFLANNNSTWYGRIDGRADGLGIWSPSGQPIRIKAGATYTGSFDADGKLTLYDGTYDQNSYKLVVNNSNAGALSHIVYDTMLIQQNDAPSLRLYESGESLSTTLASDNGVSRLASSGKLALHAGGSSTAVAYNGMGGSQAVMILTNGFVGINQGNPSYQLDVEGGSGYAARFQSTNDVQVYLKSTDNWCGMRWEDQSNADYIWYYGASKTFAIGGGGSTIGGKKLHVNGAMTVGSNIGGDSMPANGLRVEGGMQVGIGSYTGGQNTNQSIYIVSPGDTEYFTMGYKQSARSGEVMHRMNNAGQSSAFYIEAGSTEAGGICLDQDSVNVYGSSDLGTTFRVIDKDADVVTFEMLQTSWNGIFRGDVIAYGSMSSISDIRIKENIEPYENVLDRLCTLGVYSYNKITAPKHKKDKKEIGVIAQEMQIAFPELVETEKVDKPEDVNGLEEILTVDYEHLTAILLQSVKELREEVNELKRRLDGSTN